MYPFSSRQTQEAYKEVWQTQASGLFDEDHKIGLMHWGRSDKHPGHTVPFLPLLLHLEMKDSGSKSDPKSPIQSPTQYTGQEQAGSSSQPSMLQCRASL